MPELPFASAGPPDEERGPSRDDERRTAMLRTGGRFYLAGCALTILGIVLPHAGEADIGGFAAIAVATGVLAAVLLGPAGWSLPEWSFQLFMGCASALIALSLLFSAERHGGPAAANEVLFLWVALFSGYFFTRAQIAAQLGFAAAAYATALVAVDPGSIGVTRWVITMGMTSTAAGVVYGLKRRNDQLLARLTDAARTDSLTGLLNLHGFNECFELELERARRSQEPFTLVLADLDDLKAINDRLGHPSGDAALVGFGQILRDGVRRIDTAARVGGDEFALLLPAVGGSGGLQLAERLRREVAKVTASDGAPLAVSFGIVESPPGEMDRETLVQAADQALYAAKRLGRDQSVVHRWPGLSMKSPVTSPATISGAAPEADD